MHMIGGQDPLLHTTLSQLQLAQLASIVTVTATSPSGRNKLWRRRAAKSGGRTETGAGMACWHGFVVPILPPFLSTRQTANASRSFPPTGTDTQLRSWSFLDPAITKHPMQAGPRVGGLRRLRVCKFQCSFASVAKLGNTAPHTIRVSKCRARKCSTYSLYSPNRCQPGHGYCEVPTSFLSFAYVSIYRESSTCKGLAPEIHSF